MAKPRPKPPSPAPPFWRRPEPWIFIGALALRLAHLLLYRKDFWLRTALLDDSIFASWSNVIAREGWLARSLGTFYFNPAYPYFLAYFGKLFGGGPEAVFGFQHVLGAFVPVLLYRICLRLFDRRAALVAAALCALYGPAFFFESRYLGETFIYAFNAAFLFCLVSAEAAPESASAGRGPGLWWAAAGLSLGISAVFRPTGLALAAPAVLWALWTLRARARRLLGCLALFGLGLWLPLLPFQLRNRLVVPSSGWGLTTSSGGVNLHMGNNPEADGLNKAASFVHGGPGTQYQDYAAEAERQAGRAMTAKEVDRYWLGRALDWFRLRPADAWRLVLRKAGCFWNHREPPGNFFMFVFDRFTRLGALPLPGWGIAAPLGLCGMLLSLGLWRRAWLLHAYVLTYLAINAVFFVQTNYRFPAAVGLAAFAAFALTRLEGLLRGRKWLAAAALAALCAASFRLSRLRLIGEEDAAVSHYSLGVIYANQGWEDQAVEEYRLSIAANPRFPPSYLNLAILQGKRGRLDESAWALERAAGLESDPAQKRKILEALGKLRAGKPGQ